MNRRMIFRWIAAIWAGCWTGPGLAIDGEDGEYDWGPIASRFRDVNGDMRFSSIGPFVEIAESETGLRFLGVHPFYSDLADPERDRARYEVLWPIYASYAQGDQRDRRFVIAFYRNQDIHDPTSAYRFWILPVYYQGRGRDNDNYFAIFPIAGTIKHFLFQDDIRFFLWPLRCSSRTGDVQSEHVLWPLISRSEGDTVSRFRIVPFYGRASVEGQYEKKFILWPFWTQAKYTHPNAYGEAYILFPLFGRIHLNQEETYMVVPPLIRYTKSATQDKLHGPYPFVQSYDGRVKKRYLWPLWGRKSMPGNESGFFLWPLVHWKTTDRGPTITDRFACIPFYFADSVRERPEPEDPDGGEVLESYRKVWPLFSYQREGEYSRVRLVELWPFKRRGPVDRNWAPFWTLYTRTSNGTERQSELLWGMYRHHRSPTKRYLSAFPFLTYETSGGEESARSWTLLKGLIGYERVDERFSFRLLYFIKFGNTDGPS